MADEKDIVTQWFKAADEDVLLLGTATNEGLGGSEYQSLKAGKLGGPAPKIDLEAEARLQKLVLSLARAQLLSSAHDVADGGLAVALAECAAKVGAEITLDGRVTATLFGEAPSRIVISTKHAADVEKRAAEAGVPAARIGRTKALAQLSVRVGTTDLRLDTDAIERARASCLASIVGS